VRLIRADLILYCGVPIAEAVRTGLTVELPGPPGALTRETRLIRPDWYISVWDCRARPVVAVPLHDGVSWRVLDYPHRIPERILRAVRRDVYDQGGGLTMSGRYEIRSESVKRRTRSGPVEDWLAGELRGLGIDFVRRTP